MTRHDLDEPVPDPGGGLVRVRLDPRSGHARLRFDPRSGHARLRFDIAYDGTALHGWARQPGQRTVQGDLEDALTTVLRSPVRLTVAQQAVGEAERARGTRFASRTGAASAAGEDTADAVETATAEDSPEEIVDDVFLPDGERQDDGDVEPEPRRQNAAVVDGDGVSPEVAAAAAAEVEAAELGDAATAGVDAPGGESAPDPK